MSKEIPVELVEALPGNNLQEAKQLVASTVDLLSTKMSELRPGTQPIRDVSLGVVNLNSDPRWELHVFSDDNPEGGDHFEYASESRYFTVAKHPDGRMVAISVRRAESAMKINKLLNDGVNTPNLGVDNLLVSNGLHKKQDGTEIINLTKPSGDNLGGHLEVGLIIGNHDVVAAYTGAMDSVISEVAERPDWDSKDMFTAKPVHKVIKQMNGTWAIQDGEQADKNDVNWSSHHQQLMSQLTPVAEYTL